MSRKPLSFGEKVLFIGSGLLCISVLAVSWFYNYQNELPPLSVEKREIPRPNAFDEIIFAAKIAPPSPRNTYRGNKCTSINVDVEFACDTTYAQPKPYTATYNRAFPLQNKLGYLQSARPALIRWRQALSKPFYEPVEKTDTQYRLWSQKSRIEKAVRTQARAEWQRNRPDKALEWLLAWHRHACLYTTSYYNKRPNAQSIYSLTTSYNKRYEIINEITLLTPYLDARLMRHAALELQRNRLLLPSRIEALRASKPRTFKLAYRICKLNDLRVRENFEHPERAEVDRWEQLRFRWANKKAELKNVDDQWENLIALEEKNASRRGEPMSEPPITEPPAHTFNVLIPNGLGMNAKETEVREIIFITAMAARAYALEKGRNPRTLKELAPHYLMKTESDPYNPSQSLVYSPQSKSYTVEVLVSPPYAPPPSSNVPIAGFPNPSRPAPPPPKVTLRHETLPFLLYSIGPNGKDDGGKNFNQNPDPTFWNDDVLAESELFQQQ